MKTMPIPAAIADQPEISLFEEKEALHRLKHFLPAQAPLKDFIHHNTLHAFQDLKFYPGIQRAAAIFGYNVSLTLDEYRSLYQSGRISAAVLEKVLAEKKGTFAAIWKEKLLTQTYARHTSPRIGKLRANWKKQFQIDLDSMVHPLLFRILCSYLDQGISIWAFPAVSGGFLVSLRQMEKNSFTSFFRTAKVRKLFLETECTLTGLLEKVVGDESLFERYLFDQQFAHQGWSGLVSAVEDQPQTLLDRRHITLHDLIVFELLLEMDALEDHLGKKWQPLSHGLTEIPEELFAEVQPAEPSEVLSLWQDAFEWSYYEQVLAGMQLEDADPGQKHAATFQAMFCIDDRECSFRRYLERFDPGCETFGTPGFFGVEFYFQPQNGKFYDKVCPAPVNPKFLVKETESKGRRGREVVFTKQTHSLFRGLLITQTLGFWSAFRLLFNIFRPSMSPATASSFRHMNRIAKLSIENRNPGDRENDLQIGFSIEEMTIRVENLLKSIGLVKNFASLVYVVGHGSSSVNNPHYAAYDCGACSGRAGSVNSRVLSFMANHAVVRKNLAERGIDIPEETQFLGGLHDTTRDEIDFFDEASLSPQNLEKHRQHQATFAKALDFNSKERSRRFELIDSTLTPESIHEKVKIRSVSLFEPRPELNHATNALCIVGRRSLSDGLFLDRRSFLNSFDYQVDPEGKYLLNILKAAAPVCGGINLEYFFSRVDNQKLGAGSKLPHNVMGLFGVANGIDGDLRPGLPSQMIEVHDPVRLLLIVEHFPEIVLQTIQKNEATYEWFINEWVNLVAVHPETREIFRFKNGVFAPYQPVAQDLKRIEDITPLIESSQENFPVYVLQ
jgi:uncharacterized protein